MAYRDFNILNNHLIFVSFISTSGMRKPHSFLPLLCNSLAGSHSTIYADTDEYRMHQMEQAGLAENHEL